MGAEQQPAAKVTHTVAPPVESREEPTIDLVTDGDKVEGCGPWPCWPCELSCRPDACNPCNPNCAP